MSRALLVLRSDADRRKAIAWINSAPAWTRVEFKHSKRTLPQNDRFWAMLTDVAQQLTWHGVKLAPQDWKLVFMDALKQEMRLVPNIGGNGFVNLGRSSSDLTKSEMSDLMELIAEFGARHNVKFHESDAGSLAKNTAEAS